MAERPKEIRGLPPASIGGFGTRFGHSNARGVYGRAATDEYQYFERANFKRHVRKMAEARPGNRKVVHHIIAFVGPAAQPQHAEGATPAALEGSLKNTPFYRDGLLIRMKKTNRFTTMQARSRLN
jgi:hypothetical protein